MANSELLLAPKINQADLQKSQDELEQTLKRAAEAGNAEMKNSISSGLRDGARTGVNFMQARLTAGAVAVGNILANAVSQALDKTYDVTIGNLDAVRGTVEDRMSEAARLVQTAEQIGAEPEQLAAMMAAFQAQGVETDRFFAMLGTFREAINRDEMAGYQQIAEDEGVLASMLTFLRTGGAIDDPQETQRFFSNVFMRENIPFAEQFGIALQGLGDQAANIEDAASLLLGDINFTSEELREGLQRTYSEYLVLQQGSAQRYLDDISTGVNEGVGTLENQFQDSMANIEQAYLDSAERRYQAEMAKMKLELEAVERVGVAADAVIARMTVGTSEFAQNTENLIEAGNQPATWENIQNFGSALWEWGTTGILDRNAWVIRDEVPGYDTDQSQLVQMLGGAISEVSSMNVVSQPSSEVNVSAPQQQATTTGGYSYTTQKPNVIEKVESMNDVNSLSGYTTGPKK